jgi:hypothetical protein
MPLHQVLERDGLNTAGLNVDQALLGKIEVFDIIEMLSYRLRDVERLAAPGFGGKIVKTVLDILG